MARRDYNADEFEQRARIAMNSIHEARQMADNSIDALIAELHESGPGSEYYHDALEDAHVAVLMFYNRMRPYLPQAGAYWTQKAVYIEERDEDGNPEKGMFGLASLDKWRLATITDDVEIPHVGRPNESAEEEMPARMPPEVAVGAYDLLNEALVELGFGAQIDEDVPEADIDDEDAEPNNSFGETPEMNKQTADSDD